MRERTINLKAANVPIIIILTRLINPGANQNVLLENWQNTALCQLLGVWDSQIEISIAAKHR